MDNKENKGYVVDGFLFATESEAQVARKELQGILYLQKNNNLKDVKVMRQVYLKLLKQGLFHTQVGLNYLKHLQNAIGAKEGMENLPPIPVERKEIDTQSVQKMKKAMSELDDVGHKYRIRFRISLIVIMALLACVCFMIGIAATTNQPHILNYEEKIIDKYEHWEKELEEREQKLKE